MLGQVWLPLASEGVHKQVITGNMKSFAELSSTWRASVYLCPMPVTRWAQLPEFRACNPSSQLGKTHIWSGTPRIWCSLPSDLSQLLVPITLFHSHMAFLEFWWIAVLTLCVLFSFHYLTNTSGRLSSFTTRVYLALDPGGSGSWHCHWFSSGEELAVQDVSELGTHVEEEITPQNWNPERLAGPGPTFHMPFWWEPVRMSPTMY